MRRQKRPEPWRPSPTPALDAFVRNLRAVESSRVAMWLSTEAPDQGFPDPWTPLVADLETEGNAVLGAVPCIAPHGHGRDGTVPFTDACPACGAIA